MSKIENVINHSGRDKYRQLTFRLSPLSKYKNKKQQETKNRNRQKGLIGLGIQWYPVDVGSKQTLNKKSPKSRQIHRSKRATKAIGLTKRSEGQRLARPK